MLTTKENKEYRSVKHSAAWIDRSSVGKITVCGADRLELPHRLTTNDVKSLKAGEGIQTVLLNDKGRMIDVLTILAENDTARFFCSPKMSKTIVDCFEKYTFLDDFKASDDTDSQAAIQIFGPHSAQIIQEITGVFVRDLPISHWLSVNFFGVPALLYRLPTQCELSYMLVFAQEFQEPLYAHLRTIDETLPEISESVYEILRIEAGLGKNGAEWTQNNNPLEAGLVGIIHFKKGCYVGQEVIARLDSYSKVKQRLIGFVSQKMLPVGSAVVDGDEEIGVITSSAFSPDVDSFVALGYVRSLYANPNAPATIRVGEELLPAQLAMLPLAM